MRTTIGILLGLFGVQLFACAAPTPPPASPPAPGAAPVVAPAPPPTADAGTSIPAPVAAEPEPVPEKPPEPEAEEKPSRPPVEILTGPDTAFQINYSGSAPAEAARKACAGKGGADDDAIAKCMSEARVAFRPDVVRFRKDGSHWACIVYKRDNSRLDEVYAARADLTEDAPNRVKLKFTGAEKGMRPLLKTKREIVISVPNDYSFVLMDPDLGRLVYEAKVGLVGS